MAYEQSRLLWDWVNEKDNVETFLADPLEWVAGELEKFRNTLLTGGMIKKSDLAPMETLTNIIRFLNAHRNLLTPNR